MQFRGGMGEMMRQAGRLQRKVEERRRELASSTVEASAGNGQVTVVANGSIEIVKITIHPDLLAAEGLEMCQDLVAAGVNAALKQAREMVDAEIAKLTKGVKVPGML